MLLNHDFLVFDPIWCEYRFEVIYFCDREFIEHFYS
jgi:hypothetical protein